MPFPATAVTEHPNRDWIVNQLRCFTDGFKRINLITDNDQLFKHIPGTYNRQYLNYFTHLPLSEEKIFSITKDFIHYYNNFRPHQVLGNLTIPNFEKVINGQLVYSKKSYRLNNELSDLFENGMSKNFLGGIIKHYYFPHRKVS